MSGTLTVSRRLPSKQVKPSPPQVPIEERAGVHMSRDLWDVFRGDSLNRDVFSVDSRIREWEETEELHIRNMESPLPVNTAKLRLPPYGIHLLAGDMGVGKCLGEGVPVLMFDGSVKPVEDVRNGDTLMGPDSKPRSVLHTTQGRSPMYRITPTKGEPWTCNDVHMLTLIRTNEHHSKPQRGGEIVDVPLNEYLEWKPQQKMLYLQFRVGVDFPDERRLPVEPYLLGLLLGDGLIKYGVSITASDPEIVGYCGQAAGRWGCILKPLSSNGKPLPNGAARSSGYRFRRDAASGINPLKEALVAIDVYGKLAGDKRVPFQYKTASRFDRLEMLAGLMDTDGSLEQNGFDYLSKSEGLVDDVAFLARSVGLAAYKVKKMVPYKGELRTYWRVQISGHTDIIPTKVPRKQAQPRQQKKDVLRTGFKVEPIGEGDYYGFTLDGDGRFLLGDFTVTHNTLTVAWMAREYYRAGWPVYSTAGFLFGQRLRIEEAYSFPDAVHPGSFVFADEIHAMLDRYSSNSVRSRTFGQATTAMRKEHVTCIGASANSNMVDWSFRGASECVLVPRRWYPPRGRKLHAPPFCYLEISKMYPFPYRRRDPLLMDGGLLKGTEVKIAVWRPSPVELMAAAKLIDSFEAVRLGENFGIDAAAMRLLRENKEGGGAGEDDHESGQPSNRLLIVIKRAYENGYLKTSGTIALTTIRDVLKQSGLKTVTATAIKSALEMTGCEVTTRSIEAEELADLFASINLED